MRWAGWLLLVVLLSCQPSTPRACVVIQAVSIEQGFKVKGTDSPNVTIRQGDCIEFVNVDQNDTHTVQTKPGSNPPEEIPATNLPYPPHSYKVVLNLAGEYEYICSLNTGSVVHAKTMFGRITVR